MSVTAPAKTAEQTHCPECGNPIRADEPTVFDAVKQETLHEECAD